MTDQQLVDATRAEIARMDVAFGVKAYAEIKRLAELLCRRVEAPPAAPDDFAERLIARQGTIPPDVDLEEN